MNAPRWDFYLASFNIIDAEDKSIEVNFRAGGLYRQIIISGDNNKVAGFLDRLEDCDTVTALFEAFLSTSKIGLRIRTSHDGWDALLRRYNDNKQVWEYQRAKARINSLMAELTRANDHLTSIEEYLPIWCVDGIVDQPSEITGDNVFMQPMVGPIYNRLMTSAA